MPHGSSSFYRPDRWCYRRHFRYRLWRQHRPGAGLLGWILPTPGNRYYLSRLAVTYEYFRHGNVDILAASMFFGAWLGRISPTDSMQPTFTSSLGFLFAVLAFISFMRHASTSTGSRTVQGSRCRVIQYQASVPDKCRWHRLRGRHQLSDISVSCIASTVRFSRISKLSLRAFSLCDVSQSEGQRTPAVAVGRRENQV